MTTTTAIDQIRPLSRSTDAAEVATGAYRDLVALLETLREDDWLAPTECRPWTVADMVGHVLGNAESAASTREMLRQVLHGLRHAREYDGNAMDAYNELQVAEHAALTPAQRVTALRRLTAPAVRGRMRIPALPRALTLPVRSNGSFVEGMPNRENLGHLLDVVYTRDVFMHRIDVSRAVGREPSPAESDRRIVEDAVAEWARRHGQPVEVALTGPAGGTFVQGAGGPRIEMDALEFCRVLSGRAPGDGLLASKIFF